MSLIEKDFCIDAIIDYFSELVISEKTDRYQVMLLVDYAWKEYEIEPFDTLEFINEFHIRYDDEFYKKEFRPALTKMVSMRSFMIFKSFYHYEYEYLKAVLDYIFFLATKEIENEDLIINQVIALGGVAGEVCIAPKMIEKAKEKLINNGYHKTLDLIKKGDYNSWVVYAIKREYLDGSKELIYRVTINFEDYDITKLEFEQLSTIKESNEHIKEG
jgi:hypothetical protein